MRFVIQRVQHASCEVEGNITGEIGKGFLLFDPAGTLGVISSFTDETDFVVTTHALSIDVQSILNLNY